MWTSRDPQEVVPNLLDLLRKAKTTVSKTDGDEAVRLRFENIEEQLQYIKDMDVLSRIKRLEQTLSHQFTALERRLGKILVGAEISYSSVEALNDELDQMHENVHQIIQVSSPLVQHMPSPAQHWTGQYRSPPDLSLGLTQEMSQERSPLEVEDTLQESHADGNNVRRIYDDLESTELKMCCMCLSIFPEGSVIKKRPLIYWWIGEGFIGSTQEKTAEEVGEDIFEILMRKGLTQPPLNGSSSSSNAIGNNCTMYPFIRRMLISLANEARLFQFDSRWPTSTCTRACLVSGTPIPWVDELDDQLTTFFNVNDQYLGLKSNWLCKLKKVVVLQLGRWQDLPTHHIEVEDERFLKDLRDQKYLKYLSLRGISKITKLPSSILKLISLEILDLRACHNLERLPSDISSLRKLTHLDISQCHFLERMPKGLDKLSALQVIKGFFIGSLKNTPCRLGDLAKLKNLRRLSIHIGNDAVVQKGEFNDLKKISSLRRLKITWGVVSERLKAKIAFQSLDFSFPPNLEKLDLKGLLLAHVPEWLKPSQLKSLKKLCIKGGELGSLDHGETESWTVEILHLHCLSNLEIGVPRLKEVFPRLQHLEKINCHEIETGRYDEDAFWSRAED